MKRNWTQILTLLLALIFNVHSIFAQGVEENPEIRNYLNNMFSTLDKSKVPNALVRQILATPYSVSANNIVALDGMAYQYSYIKENALSDEEVIWLNASQKMGIDGPKLAKTGSPYKVINPLSGTIIWSTSNSNIATVSSSGILTAVSKGIVDVKAKVGTTEASTRVAVGIPRFVLANVKRDPAFYTIKASCIDTEPGYAAFILNNRDLIVYQWGIKTGNQPIQWTDSESAEVKLSTEDTENTTIYLKVKDYNGNVSSPIFVRITGYDIYDLGYRTFIVNKNGQLFTDTGYELYYENTGMPLIFRSTSYDEFSNAEWSPLAGTMINEEKTQWVVPWYTNFYIKDILTPAEIERIKLNFVNNQIAFYSFFLLNYDGKIIQKTPISVIYKENYPKP